MVNCRVLDCKHINREKWLCQLDMKTLSHDNKGSCVSYVTDMVYLRAEWKYERADNGELVKEIRLILVDAIDTQSGGLLAAEIQQGLLDRGIEISSQKIVNLIRHRGQHIKIRTITNSSKWINLYYTDPPPDLEENEE